MPFAALILFLAMPIWGVGATSEDAGWQHEQIRGMLEWAGFEPDQAERATAGSVDGVVRINIDFLRSSQPDRFAPGPVNEALGQMLLANAAACSVELGDRLRVRINSRRVFRASNPGIIDIGTRSAQGEWLLDIALVTRWLPGLARAVVLVQTDDEMKPIESWELRLRQALRRLDHCTLSVNPEPQLDLTFQRGLSEATVRRMLDAMVRDHADEWSDRRLGPVIVTVSTESAPEPVTISLVWRPVVE